MVAIRPNREPICLLFVCWHWTTEFVSHDWHFQWLSTSYYPQLYSAAAVPTSENRPTSRHSTRNKWATSKFREASTAPWICISIRIRVPLSLSLSPSYAHSSRSRHTKLHLHSGEKVLQCLMFLNWNNFSILEKKMIRKPSGRTCDAIIRFVSYVTGSFLSEQKLDCNLSLFTLDKLRSNLAPNTQLHCNEFTVLSCSALTARKEMLSVRAANAKNGCNILLQAN